LSDFELNYSDTAAALSSALRGPSPPAGVGSPQGVTTESFRAIVVPNAGLPSLTYVLSGAKIAQFFTGEVTFARFLPDTSTLPGPQSTQILQTGAPIIVQAPGDVVRVVANDAGARVTELRLWVWDMRTKITFPRPIRPVRVTAV
jgi:hypothetical protein